MAEYPSNSNKARESSLVREPISSTTHEIKQNDSHPRVPQNTKRHTISPVKEVFAAIFPGGFAEVKEKLVWDIFVPWVQDMLHSGWQSLGNVIFPGSNRTNKPPETYSYDQQYHVRYPEQNRSKDLRPMATREQASDALRDLRDILRRYGVVTLLDYNERVGLDTNATQSNYGWLNLDFAYIERVNGGWVLRMPSAAPIDNMR